MREVCSDVDHPGLLGDALSMVAIASSPPLTARDIFSLGVSVFSLRVARPFLPKGRPADVRDVETLIGVSAGCIASNAPAIASAAGFRITSLAMGALRVVMEEGRSDLAATDSRFSRLAKTTLAKQQEPLAQHERCVTQSVLAWITNALRPSMTAVDAGGERAAQHAVELVHWHDMLWDEFVKPVLPSAAQMANTILVATQRKGMQANIRDRADVADDLWSEWVAGLFASDEPTTRKRRLSVYVGRDGGFKFDGRGFLDRIGRAARFNAKTESGPEGMTRHSLEHGKLDHHPASMASSAAELASSREEQVLHQQVVDVLLAAATDEIDREELRLLQEEGMSRRAIAKRLDLSEAALRKREKRLKNRALAIAPPALKRRIRDLMGE